MILADTSVWIDHLRRRREDFSRLLNAEAIVCHPFVIGEIAVGAFRSRSAILRDLKDIQLCIVASDEEVLEFIEHHRLYGRGIGYVDTHLLAAVRITPGSSLWTFDNRLNRAAEELGLAFKPADDVQRS